MGLVVVIWCYPCFPCSYFSRTYCDLWHRWLYYNGMDNAEWKPNMHDMQEGSHSEKKKSVAGQFAAVKYKSETNVLLDSKTKQGGLRGRQVLNLTAIITSTNWYLLYREQEHSRGSGYFLRSSCCCKRGDTAEKTITLTFSTFLYRDFKGLVWQKLSKNVTNVITLGVQPGHPFCCSQKVLVRDGPHNRLHFWSPRPQLTQKRLIIWSSCNRYRKDMSHLCGCMWSQECLTACH